MIKYKNNKLLYNTWNATDQSKSIFNYGNGVEFNKADIMNP